MKKKMNGDYNAKSFMADVNRVPENTLLKAPCITIMPRMITDAYKKGKTLRNSMYLKGAMQA